MDHKNHRKSAATDNNVFEQQYVCYPFSESSKFSDLQAGNRIVMPASALDTLARLKIQYPMAFSINKSSTNKTSHCGVLEFVADEGTVLLPNSMMYNLQLKKGDLVTLRNKSLPKATYIKIQPHKTRFIDGLRDPRGVLEHALKDFSCLTLGDTIAINHNYGEYKVDIVETKPSNAVSVVETDCVLDFAQPLDYKPPPPPPTPKPKPKVSNMKRVEEASSPVFVPFSGVARRLDGQAPAPKVDNKDRGRVGAMRHQAVDKLLRQLEVSEGEDGSKSSFKPFSGLARRLDEQPKRQRKRKEEDISSDLNDNLSLSKKRSLRGRVEEGKSKKAKKMKKQRRS